MRPPAGRLPAPLLAALLLAALLGCEATPPPRSTGTGPAAGATPTGALSSAGPAGTTAPAPGPVGSTGPALPAYATVPAPAERPARLAEARPGRPGGWVARLWFGGVPVDRDSGRPVVAYVAVELNSDGTRTVAHAKLALFRCVRRQAAGSPNFVGCTDRKVEYGDLAGPQLRVATTSTGAFTVSGSVPTYSYGGAVDRGVDLPVRWTGRSFPIRVTCAPDPEPVCRPGRPGRSARSASVVLGRDAAGRAGLDFGYLNRLTR